MVVGITSWPSCKSKPRNMAKTTKRFFARDLRKKGLSISEIAEKLDMHKSGTISMWCRDISLTPEQTKKLIEKQRSGSCKGVEKLRRARLREVELLKKKGLKEIGKLTRRDLFLAGVGIYWSEGYTYSGGDQVGFTNSDPRMILFMIRWFEKICKVSKKKFSLAVRINEIHKKRVGEIEKYWSELTEVPLSQFNKTVLIRSKSKKVYPNPNNYFGTIRVTIRGGTRLRRKIHGWIEGLARVTRG